MSFFLLERQRGHLILFLCREQKSNILLTARPQKNTRIVLFSAKEYGPVLLWPLFREKHRLTFRRIKPDEWFFSSQTGTKQIFIDHIVSSCVRKYTCGGRRMSTHESPI
jgi:hypothetical protein